MSQTQAEAEVMAQTAGKFEAVNSTLQSMLSRLMGELEVLQTAWVGQGGNSFTQVKEAWRADQQAIQRALQETANAIRTSGQQYSSSDSEAAGRVAGAHTGVQLPL